MQNQPTMPTQLEIERKFLVRTLPPGFSELPAAQIDQGYAEDGLRFRRRDDRYFETRKFSLGLVNEEQELELSREEFDAGWPSTETRRLEKQRTRFPLDDGLVAEIDVFEGSLEGLLYVEVEFPSVEKAKAFEPPEWFGREVTDDYRYKNSSLARFGLPDDWEKK